MVWPNTVANSSHRSDLPGLKERVVRSLASSEAYLSPTEWDIKNHNLIHLVEQIMALGKSVFSPKDTVMDRNHACLLILELRCEQLMLVSKPIKSEYSICHTILCQ